jgi:hypothetical protein
MFAAVCNIAVGGKEALQNLLRNLYAPLPIVGNAYGAPHPLSFVETLLATEPQDYPQFVEMVPLPPTSSSPLLPLYSCRWQVINEIVWLHLVCCSPIVPVCQVCPSDPPQAFLWQSSLKSIHTHFLETLQLCISSSTPQHMQNPSLRAVYFAPDIAISKDDMDPHNRSQTDVSANIDHVLRQLWGHLYDHTARTDPNPPSESRESFIDNALRKHLSPSLRASALFLCQNLPEAARVLDEGNLPLDACVLSCVFETAGLCPRFERSDGPCVGAAGFMIKSFFTNHSALGSALLPTGQDSTIDLCCYLALALDGSQNLSLNTVLPSSDVSIQLLAFIFAHLFRSRQTAAVFSFPLERAVQLRLDPARSRTIALSGGCRYLEEMCRYVAKRFEEDTKGDALRLVEAARMYAAAACIAPHARADARCRYKYSKNFEKFAELLIQAAVCCIPLPHQYAVALDAAAQANVVALRSQIASILMFEVALASPQDAAFSSWCVVGGIVNSKVQYLSQLVSVAYAFELSRKLPFDSAAILVALMSGPPSSVLDWSVSTIPELRRTPLSCFSPRDPSRLSLIPVDSADVGALAVSLATAAGGHFTPGAPPPPPPPNPALRRFIFHALRRLLASRVGSTCLLLLDALKAQPAAAQRSGRQQARVCNDFLNALMLSHTVSVDVANAGAAKFAELLK